MKKEEEDKSVDMRKESKEDKEKDHEENKWRIKRRWKGRVMRTRV